MKSSTRDRLTVSSTGDSTKGTMRKRPLCFTFAETNLTPTFDDGPYLSKRDVSLTLHNHENCNL